MERHIGLVDRTIKEVYGVLIVYCRLVSLSTKLRPLLSYQTSNAFLQAFLNMRSTPYVMSPTSLSFLSTLCWLCCQSRATLLFSLLFCARNPSNAPRCFFCAAFQPPTSSGQYFLLSTTQSSLFLRISARSIYLRKKSLQSFFLFFQLLVV